MARRVVVTGMAGLTPIGRRWQEVRDALAAGRSGVSRMSEWNEVPKLGTRVGGAIRDFEMPARWPRKKTRTLGRVAQLAVDASERAIEDAGLLGSELLSNGRTGVAYGSASGSKASLVNYATALAERHSTRGITATDYHKLSPHTCSANIAQFFEVRGRQLSTSTACTSGSQAIGLAYEMIQFGKQDLMIAGGAEELSIHDAVVFDVMRAASTRNHEPSRASRPFDRDRDGVVVAEGAATLVLEELEHARARGAHIISEIVGFGTNCDGAHMTSPDTLGMQGAMELALQDAGLQSSDIGYVGAHGTSTEQGDIAESQATARLFGPELPISSMKGHIGHPLGAAGSIEAWLTISMQRDGWFAPTLNLEHVDERCAELDYLQKVAREFEPEFVMTNNFAFGGVNTSLVVRRWQES
jgi:3-oxoacyl-[acyl-carrier-protein] synthase II